MSKKLEKLREVNKLLKEILSNLETQMFIENIDETIDKKINAEYSKVVVEIK